MPKFRKKPVVIEARQFLNDETRPALVDWCNARGSAIDDDGCDYETKNIFIATLEGEMMAKPGDWIIQGVSGEFYPCKPDIFEATYEEVEVTL